jgi:hypothetical protein
MATGKTQKQASGGSALGFEATLLGFRREIG